MAEVMAEGTEVPLAVSPEHVAATFEFYINAATHVKNDVEVRTSASSVHLEQQSIP